MLKKREINIIGKAPSKMLYSGLIFGLTAFVGLQNIYAQGRMWNCNAGSTANIQTLAAKDRVPSIEGTWILDTAVVIQSGDGKADTSIYLFGDTSMVYERSQPPQKIVITPKTVTFEYSTSNPQIGKYSFDGNKLRICFRYIEEYACHLKDPEHLLLRYTVYMSAYSSGKLKQIREDGFFKVRKQQISAVKMALQASNSRFLYGMKSLLIALL
jgi:hypothetical protein